MIEWLRKSPRTGGGMTRKPQLPLIIHLRGVREMGRLLIFLQEGRISSDWATQRLFDLYP